MFFSRISRAATKRSFQAARNFSGDPAVAAKEASTWVKYSVGKFSQFLVYVFLSLFYFMFLLS